MVLHSIVDKISPLKALYIGWLLGFASPEYLQNFTCKVVHGSVQVAEAASEMDGDQKKFSNYSYPAMTKTQGSFKLSVEAGKFTDSEILVMLGENGTGGPQRLRCFAPHCCSCLAAFELLQQTAKDC